MYVIIEKASNKVAAYEDNEKGQESYNPAIFDWICWNTDLDGKPPKIGSVFADTRTKENKRKAMYLNCSDKLFVEWQGQIVDGDVAKALAAETAWKEKRMEIRGRYP